MTPDRWVDFLLNLITEALGILVTVFLVDRILKRRGEARWKPAKNFVYSRLTEIVWGVFSEFAPSSLHKDMIFARFFFGKVPTGPVKDIGGISLRYLEVEPLLDKELADKPIKAWLDQKTTFLVDTTRAVDRIINDAGIFLAPEELSQIFSFREATDKFLSLSSNFTDLPDINFSSWSGYILFPHRIYDLLEITQNTETWLIQRSTNRYDIDEEFKIIFEDLKSIIKKGEDNPMP